MNSAPTGQRQLDSAGVVHNDLILISMSAAGTASENDVLFQIDAIAQRILGHRFITVMRLRDENLELERIYSSHPVEFPILGRKSAKGAPWAEHVLALGRVLIGSQTQDLHREFIDHRELIALGLGSVISTPILFGGRCLGTLNLFHEAGWYRPRDEQVTRVLAYLLTPVLLAGRSPD